MKPSRLVRMLHRLGTQRACLEEAASLIADLPGPILELGLGKGRTYDHLRGLLPKREIFAFDRVLHAPADCVPADDHLVLGELRETLRVFRPPGKAALIHADIGSEDAHRDGALTADLARLLPPLLRPGGVVLCDRPLQVPGWKRLAVPRNAADWPYFVYRSASVGVYTER